MQSDAITVVTVRNLLMMSYELQLALYLSCSYISASCTSLTSCHLRRDISPDACSSYKYAMQTFSQYLQSLGGASTKQTSLHSTMDNENIAGLYKQQQNDDQFKVGSPSGSVYWTAGVLLADPVLMDSPHQPSTFTHHVQQTPVCCE